MEYKSVERFRLQAAFGLAHRAAENFDTPAKERKTFRAIAKLLWDACGEKGTPKKGTGAEMLEKMDAASVIGKVAQ